MKLVEELYKHIAQEAFGTLKFKIGEYDIDLGRKWEKYDYVETVKKYAGLDITAAAVKQIEEKLKKLNIDYEIKGFNLTRGIDNIWKFCRQRIIGPGFLVGVPTAVSPLAKTNRQNPYISERFQPIIAGSELGNGYSELNDPLQQAKRFAQQQKLRDAGDDEAQMHDHDFVEALEYGMPPTAGEGIGIDRLTMLLTDSPSIREVILFPHMKPL